jgi:hypothetical protein
VQVYPVILSTDATYDAQEIRQYNWKMRIWGNILVNGRSWRQSTRGRPARFDPKLYKKRNAVEWFFYRIEAFRIIVPFDGRYEHSWDKSTWYTGSCSGKYWNALIKLIRSYLDMKVTMHYLRHERKNTGLLGTSSSPQRFGDSSRQTRP